MCQSRKFKTQLTLTFILLIIPASCLRSFQALIILPSSELGLDFIFEKLANFTLFSWTNSESHFDFSLTLSNEVNTLKGGLISDFFFSFWLKSPKEVLNHKLECFPHSRGVVPGGAMAHPDFGRPLNPISTRGDTGDRLFPSNYYWHSRIFRPCDAPEPVGADYAHNITTRKVGKSLGASC